MITPYFSVCIPNYNYGHYIGKTIESVLAQSFKDFEIIVSDNASSDNSVEVVSAFAKSNSQIRLLTNNYNVGFAPNLQHATQHAKGKHLILLSSDDLMHPNALQVYYETLQLQGEKSDRTVLHSAFNQVDEHGNYIRSVYRGPGKFEGAFALTEVAIGKYRLDYQDPIEAIRYGLRTNKGIGAFLTICFPRIMWERVEGYDTQYFIFPDKAFLFKLLLCQPDYIYVNDILFSYRIHPSNQNSTNAGQAALKHQVDGYMRVVNFNAEDLQKINFSRKDLKIFFIRNLCERHAIAALAQNYRLKAFKIISYAWATFPEITVKRVRIYAVMGLLMLGPIGYLLLRSVRKWSSRLD